MEKDDVEITQPNDSNQQKSEKKARTKHKCPFPSCSAEVIHLPRHMRQRHQWGTKDASKVLNSFGLRKRHSTACPTKKPRKSMLCPVYGCSSVVKRLHNHLTDFHHFERGSEVYKEALQSQLPHEVAVISSESTPESSSSEDESYKPKKKKRVQKKREQKKQSIFKMVYPSSEEETREEVNPIENRPSTSKQEQSDVEFSGLDYVPEQQNNGSNSESSDDSKYDEESENEADNDCLNIPEVVLPDEQDMFKHFEKWLESPDGSRKSEPNAIQCSRQVQLVLQYINPEKPSLEDLLCKRTLRDEWLSKFEKERRPGTVKSYLGALKQFYVFLECECPDRINAPSTLLSAMSAQMTQWSKSYRKLVKDRFWEKRMEDLSKLRSPEQIQKFESSELARKAVSVLGRFQADSEEILATQSEYTLVRDYLLTLICINNGSRSGALANMTIREFKDAQAVDDCFVVKVKKHKTFTTHGPAHLVLSATLYNWMKIFIAKLRATVVDGKTSEDDELVFLTWSNRPMGSSLIGSQINSSWAKIFGKEAGCGGATAFRKAAVSAVHQNDKSRREELAGLMVHNKATADRYYLMQEKSVAAVKTSKYLSKVMRSDASTSKSKDKTKDIDQPNTPSCSREFEPEKRHKWLPEEEEAMKTIFAKDITNRCITMSKVREEIENHPLLGKLSPSKVKDKVRTFFDNSPIDLQSLPEETSEERLIRTGYKTQTPKGMQEDDSASEYTPSIIPPSTHTCMSKKSSQKLFGDDEYETFYKLFKDLIESKKPISKAMVKERIEGEPKLCHLLKKYSLLQLADKVRTERRIIARNSSRK